MRIKLVIVMLAEDNAMRRYAPLVAAVLSAAVILFGYVYEKDKEREFQIRRTQQEIYTRLITNLIIKQDHLDRLKKTEPRMPHHVTRENIGEVQKLIANSYPELQALIYESREIMALLSVYGTDKAIEASVRFYLKGISSMEPGATERPNPGQFILELRRSLFKDTRVKAEDINIIIGD